MEEENMQSFILGSEKWGYIGSTIIVGSCIWFIFDYFFIHKTQDSIHRILGLSDNIYKTLCIIFIILGALGSFYVYSIFFKLDIQENGKIRLHYLIPRPTVTFHKSLIKSYKIETTKANYRVLWIYLKNGKKYKAIEIGTSKKEIPYQYQLNYLIATLDNIIQKKL